MTQRRNVLSCRAYAHHGPPAHPKMIMSRTLYHSKVRRTSTGTRWHVTWHVARHAEQVLVELREHARHRRRHRHTLQPRPVRLQRKDGVHLGVLVRGQELCGHVIKGRGGRRQRGSMRGGGGGGGGCLSVAAPGERARVPDGGGHAGALDALRGRWRRRRLTPTAAAAARRCDSAQRYAHAHTRGHGHGGACDAGSRARRRRQRASALRMTPRA